MTLPVNPNRVAYSGNGTITAFAFPYRFFDEEDLKVVIRNGAGDDTTKTIDTDFSVTGADEDSGGTVTMITAPDASSTLIIFRDPDLEQELDLQDLAVFPSEEVEREFDRQVALLQRLDERLDRAITLADADSSVTLTVPLLADRTSKFMAFDSSGRIIASSGTAGASGPVSTFMDTVLDDTDAAAALSTLGFSTFAKTLVDDTDATQFLGTLGFSTLMKDLRDDTDASQHLGTLGFSTLMKNLRDDTDASQHLATLGVLTALQTVLLSADASNARLNFAAIDQTHSVISTGSTGHGSASTRIRQFTTNTALGSAITVASDTTLGTVYTIAEAGLFSMTYQDKRAAGGSQIGISLDNTGTDLTTSILSLPVAKMLAASDSGSSLSLQVSAVARLAVGQKLRAHGSGDNDSTQTQFRIHRIGN